MAEYPVKVVGQDGGRQRAVDDLIREIGDLLSEDTIDDLVRIALRSYFDAAPSEPTDAVVELVRAAERLCNDGVLTGLDQKAGWDVWFSDANHALDRLRTACPELVEMAEKGGEG